MSNIIIELFDLNNAPLIPSGRIDGVENFTVSYKRDDEQNIISSSYSSELTFYDDGYDLIYNALINNPTGFNEKIKVNIYDKCCNRLVFTGYIKGDSIDWCESKCSVKANVIYEDDSLSCIKNKFIWDNTYGFLNNDYNPINYCILTRPQFIQIVLYFLGLFAEAVALVLAAIISLVIGVIWTMLFPICLIVAVLNPFDNLTLSDCIAPYGLINDTWNIYQGIKNALLPCNDYHVAAFLRDYINNACRVCGLNFKSSILNDPTGRIGSIYYDTVLLSMQVKKGRYTNGTSWTNKTLIQDNLPLETLETLFRDYLNPLFNARYRIIGNDLIFERKDYFYAMMPWIDANQLLFDGKVIDNNICWTWIDKERYSYGKYEYSLDAMEYVGNEAKNQYGDIVEWNPASSYDSSQTGSLVMTSKFSPLRYVDDQYSDSWDNIYAKGTELLMSQQNAFNYKIFIYNTLNGPVRPVEKNRYTDAFVSNIPGGPNPKPPTEVLSLSVDERGNYPYWFVEGQDGVYGAQNNLYSLFHYIDNPRLPGAVQYNFEFKFEFDCQQYIDFSFDKYVSLKRGPLSLNGKVTDIEVDFNKRIIQVKGVA